MKYAIILAGGIGSRFWPLTSDLEPKQFINFASNKPMLREAVERISGLVERENVYISSNKLQSKKILSCLRGLDIKSGNIHFEPERKNTLAPIGVLTNLIRLKDKEAVVVVMPCDHFVRDRRKFLKYLSRGIEAALRGYIVTLGMPPKRPETGYGYIQIEPEGIDKKLRVYRVKRFIEKPDLRTAKKLIRNKNIFWNGGIFIFKPGVLLAEIKKFQPHAYKIIMKIKNRRDSDRFWHNFPDISVDYAVMEKTEKITVLPADYGWIDLGSWQALYELFKKDKNGNVFKCASVDLGSKNTFVWSDKVPVATLGLEDTIIVNTPDVLLVCRKDLAQDVKKIAQIIREKNYRQRN